MAFWLNILIMCNYSKDKEISKLIKELIKLGWVFKRRKKHGLIYSPCGGRATVPCTPSDYRAFYNFRRDIRKLSSAGEVYA